jgi:hypothetical protein
VTPGYFGTARETSNSGFGSEAEIQTEPLPLFAFVRVESGVVDWAQRILVGKGGLAPPL